VGPCVSGKRAGNLSAVNSIPSGFEMQGRSGLDSRMRIIAGVFRRRVIESPPDSAVTRPIPDRVKESLFGMLRGNCEEANVFDGFAGTGAIGLEAISRGAARCTFVERDKKMGELLRRNVELLGVVDRCDVVVADALGAGALARAPRPLTLAFLDPPYPMMEDQFQCQRVMTQLASLMRVMAPDGFAVLRTPWPLKHEVLPEVEPPPMPMRGGKYAHKYTGKQNPKSKDAWKREKRLWEKGQDPSQHPSQDLSQVLKQGSKRASARPSDGAVGNEKGVTDEAEVVEWFEAEEVPGMIEQTQLLSLNDGQRQWKEVDLRVAGSVGPETHVYGGMAVHLYAKAKAE